MYGKVLDEKYTAYVRNIEYMILIFHRSIRWALTFYILANDKSVCNCAVYCTMGTQYENSLSQLSPVFHWHTLSTGRNEIHNIFDIFTISCHRQNIHHHCKDEQCVHTYFYLSLSCSGKQKTIVKQRQIMMRMKCDQLCSQHEVWIIQWRMHMFIKSTFFSLPLFHLDHIALISKYLEFFICN